MPEMSDTEKCEHAPIPEDLKDYWRCFHCDFHTTNREEAEAHFGDRDDAEEFKPICKWWANMDDAERRAEFQDALQDLNYERMENHKQDKQTGEAKSALFRSESARDQLRIERDAAREALRKAYVAMAENNAPFDPDVWADAVNSVASALATPLGTPGRKP